MSHPSFLRFTLATVAAFALWACGSRPDSVAEAERLAATTQTEMALKYADDAFTHLDRLNQIDKCRLTVAYFRISDIMKANGDSTASSHAYANFLHCYGESLKPDSSEAYMYYLKVNLHVAAMFNKFYNDSKLQPAVP